MYDDKVPAMILGRPDLLKPEDPAVPKPNGLYSDWIGPVNPPPPRT